MTTEPLLLLLHTTDETAFAALAKKNTILGVKKNDDFKKHAAFLHPAIDALLKETGAQATDLSAISVTHGPGSYTGIRVGLAAAKGLCYALDIPLVTISSLKALAASARANNRLQHPLSDPIFCPMIDARRMEVYMALYASDLEEIEAPQPKILTPKLLRAFPKHAQIYFFGSGSAKWKQMLEAENQVTDSLIFFHQDIEPAAMADYSLRKWNRKEFSDIAYSHPAYLKEFGE